MRDDDSVSLSGSTTSDSSTPQRKKMTVKKGKKEDKKEKKKGQTKSGSPLKGKKKSNKCEQSSNGRHKTTTSSTRNHTPKKYESDSSEDSSDSFGDPLVGVTKEVSRRTTLDRTTSTSSATRKVTGYNKGSSGPSASKSKGSLISDSSEDDSSARSIDPTNVAEAPKMTSPSKAWVKQANGSWAHGSTSSVNKATSPKAGAKSNSLYDSDSDSDDDTSSSDDSKQPIQRSPAKRPTAANMARLHSSVPALKSPSKSFHKKDYSSDSESSSDSNRKQTKAKKDVTRKVPPRTKSLDATIPKTVVTEKKKTKKTGATTKPTKNTKATTKTKKALSSSSSSDSEDSLDLQEFKEKANTSFRTSPARSKSLPLAGGKAKPSPSASTSQLNESQSSLNASSSRITVIDPMSRAFPKLERPPLPEVEGNPDWLFKPKDGKRPSILGIASSMDFQDRSIDSFLEKLRGASEHGDEGKMTGPKEKLFKLLNHDPSWADERKNYRDDEARQVIKDNPEVAKEKYMFASGKEKIFPLSMLAALHASVKTLRACYKAHPSALEYNDRWIGTAAHYACAYRSPLAVLSYLVEKDESILEAKNQFGRLPMHLACMVLTPLEKIEYLVKEYKKALSVKDKDGMTPLHHACNRTDPDLNVISFLSKSNRAACVAQNSKGCTPLHLAVQHQTPINILQALLAANTDIFSIADGEGNLPVHTALQANAETNIIQFCVWNHSDGLSHYNAKNERPIEMAMRIRKRDRTLHEILEPY